MFYKASPKRGYLKIASFLIVTAAVVCGLVGYYSYKSDEYKFIEDGKVTQNLHGEWWNPVTYIADDISSMKYIIAKAKFWSNSMDSHSAYDMNLTPKQRAHKHGYNFHEHFVLTDDKYKLGLFQIAKRGLSKNAPVVLLQHGLSEDANTYMRNKELSPAFILAAQGFNVFLGNNRGTRYSRVHLTWNVNKDAKKWFDYSFYELGQYDLPAFINFILEHTGKTRIGYIGHSQGTSQMFSALAENHGQLNDKISTFIALAPVASFRYQQSRKTEEEKIGLHNVLKKAKQVTYGNGIYELGPSLKTVKAAKTLLWPFMSKRDYDLMFHSSISIKQLLHYGQLELAGRFRQFDYGTKENYQRYNSPMPPLIELKNIRVPISMFVGKDDMIASPMDAQNINRELSRPVEYYEVLETFDHDQFATDLTMNYFHKVVSLLKKHTK